MLGDFRSMDLKANGSGMIIELKKVSIRIEEEADVTVMAETTTSHNADETMRNSWVQKSREGCARRGLDPRLPVGYFSDASNHRRYSVPRY